MKINLNSEPTEKKSPFKPSTFKLDLSAVPNFKNILDCVRAKTNESTSSIDCDSPTDMNTLTKDCRSEMSFHPTYFPTASPETKFVGGQTPSYVGLPAIKMFNNKFMVSNKAAFTEETHSATFAYLRACETSRRPPRLNGIAKVRGVSTDINLNYYSIGDIYAKAVSQSIKHSKPNTIKLCDNRLTQDGASNLIESFGPTLKSIDLSINKIGKRGIERLASYLTANID